MRDRWLCTVCGRRGFVRYRKNADVLTVSEKIRQEHDLPGIAGGCRYDPDVIMINPPLAIRSSIPNPESELPR